MNLNIQSGLIDSAEQHDSPNCDDRENHTEPEVIILHCISLPPGNYQTNAITDFFCNQLDSEQDPYFAEIADLKVSSHFLIRRDGQLIQYVPTTKRAWHAGESVCLGKPAVNDFSIGIELEGIDTDQEGFTDSQYSVLNDLITCLRKSYTSIKTNNVFAHSDIAPGRKSDPGPYFLWSKLEVGF